MVIFLTTRYDFTSNWILRFLWFEPDGKDFIGLKTVHTLSSNEKNLSLLRDSNLEQLGEKREDFLCATSLPRLGWFRLSQVGAREDSDSVCSNKTRSATKK